MATNNNDRLPPELLANVMKHVPTDLALGYHDLRNASLVCKQWQHAAQAQLWKVVYASGKDELQQLIDSAGTARYRVDKLRLYGTSVNKQRISPPTVSKTLDVLQGLKELEMVSINGMNGGLLYHPALRELTWLRIHGDPAYNEKKIASLPAPPYKLKDLRLWSFKYSPGVDLLRPIFVASIDTLTNLQIVFCPETSSPLFELLPLVISKLKHLTLSLTGYAEIPLRFLNLSRYRHPSVPTSSPLPRRRVKGSSSRAKGGSRLSRSCSVQSARSARYDEGRAFWEKDGSARYYRRVREEGHRVEEAV